jgi:hypothetical protein
MTALALLDEVRSFGVEIRPDGGELVIRPAGRLPHELKQRLKAAKPEILAVLSCRPSTCAASCYQVEPGRWIHHPWDGCKTVASLKPAPAVREPECRHCDGAGECPCSACTLGRTKIAVPCLACHPMARQAWLAATRPEGCWHCYGTGKCACFGCDRSGVCQVCRNRGREKH